MIRSGSEIERAQTLNIPTPDPAVNDPASSLQPAPSFDVLQFLRNWKWVGVSVFLFAAVAGLPIAFWKGKPVYRATAVIYISPSVTRNPSDERERDGGAYNTYVHQQGQNLLRRSVLESAIQNMANAGILWRHPDESMQNAVDRLLTVVDVQRVPETYQLEVSLTSEKPTGLAVMVNAVVHAYLESVSSDGELGTREKLAALRDERDHVAQLLTQATNEQALLTTPLASTNFSNETALPQNEKGSGVKAQLADARLQRREAVAHLEMFEKLGTPDNKAGASPEEEALRVRLTSLNEREAQIQNRLADLRVRDMGPSHPVRQAAEDDLRHLQQERVQVEIEANNKIRARLQAEYQRAERLEQELTAEATNQDAQLPGLAKTYYKAIEGSSLIASLRQRMTVLDERVAALELEAKSPGSIRLFAEAIAPMRPYKGGRQKMALGALAVAFLIAAISMFAADKIVQPVRSAGEVEAIVGFSPVGVLLRGENESFEFGYEQFLRFVGGIERARHTLNAQTFAVTPLQAGGGVSELVDRLGSAMKKRGLKVLIVEANAFEMKSPTEGAAERSGVGEMLVYGAPEWRSIIPGDPLKADRLSLGCTYGEPRLPEISRLRDLLPQFASRYQIVLMDAPPLLVSADAEHLVSLCDATLLVIDSAVDSKKDVRKGTQKLKYLRPDRIGAILANLDLNKADSALIREARQYNRARRLGRARIAA